MDDTLAAPNPPENGEKPVRKKSWLRRILRCLLIGFAGILVLVLVLAVGLGFWIRTDQARTLVHEQVNKQLDPILAPMGLHCRLDSLAGTLPLTWVAGLTVSDEKGIWLTVPEARVDVDFGLFPPRLQVDELHLVRASLERLPELPESPEEPVEPPSPPMTPESLEKLLQDLSHKLAGLPDSLPSVTIRKTGLTDFSLSKDICGFPVKVTALLEGAFGASEKGGAPKVTVRIPKLSVASEPLNFTGNVAWTSGANEATWLAGDLSLAFDSTIDPKHFVQGDGFSADPVALKVKAAGPLFSPNFSFSTSCPLVESAGHVLKESDIRLSSAPLDLAAFLAKDRSPLLVDLSIGSILDGQPVSLSLRSFANLLRRDSFAHMNCGIRDLKLSALGLSANGGLSAQVGEGIPPVSGTLHAEIPDASSLAAFVPDATIAGRVSTDIVLSHTKESGQAAALDLSVPSLVFTPRGGEPLRVNALSLAAKLGDALGKGPFTVHLAGQRISAGPLQIGVQGDVSGAVAGPIRVAFSTEGGIRTALRASLDKESLALDAFSFQTNPGLFAKEFAHVKTPLALRLSKPVRVQFGADGFSLSELDVRMQPQGRIWARGGIRNAVCDLNLGLDAFDLKAWRALVKDLPEGLVRFTCQLKGAVRSPTGSFRLSVDRLAVPKVKLEPFDLGVTGVLEQRGGSRLKVNLEVPEKTVRTLGGERLLVTCALPLAFAENGVPSVPEKGQLDGKVVWKGKVAPLWKFSPMADCKLSGVLDCDIALGGTVSAPSVKGSVVLDKGRFDDPIQGILLRDIAAKVGIDGRTTAKGLDGMIRIDAGLSDGMGGKLTVAGTTPLDASKLAIKTTIDHLKPLRRQDVRISLSGGIDVTGSAEAPVVAGTITVDNGAIQLENIEAGPSGVTTLPIADGKEPAQKKKNTQETAKTDGKKRSSPKGPGSLNIAIKSPGRFIVDGFGLSTEWKTDIAITGTPSSPVIDGEVTAVKGTMDFLNKIFKLEKGVVVLNADTISNPLIDIKMANTTADITSYILISGTVKKLKLSLSSEPPMPQDDVMAHILFGKNANELGRSEALQLAAALARMASGLGSGLNNPRKVLGLDVMRLKSGGQSGSSSDDKWVEGMALESGKYLTDSIYVGVEQGVKQDSTAGVIQLEITPTLKLEMRTQQSSTKGSLNWKYNY